MSQFRSAFWAALSTVVMGTASAAPPTSDNSDSPFDPRQTFAPFRMPDPVNRYRSADGLPGPDYWQNRADYRMHATLDVQHKQLAGEETITYTNHSPNVLQALWLQLDQNRYRRDARANFSSGQTTPPADAHTSGEHLDAVTIESGGQRYSPDTQVSDTRLRIALARPLAANGGKLVLHIRYHYTIPSSRFGGRTGWAPSPHGLIFDIAQWYPRMCVYDDIRGWNTAPFLNQEFYTEYGDFDYRVTAPAGMLVAGAGRLVNADDVLDADERQRLGRARHSDRTVTVRRIADVRQARHAADGTSRTWHFRMRNARDVAFAASRAFVWDAARINLPGDRHALAMSVYPPASGGHNAWGRSTEYLKASIEDFSRRWYAYPYPTAVAVGGPVGGMEYPGMAFDSRKATGQDLFMITAHEIGHSWFPMIVGSDERRHAWMDEGMNTFIDVLAQADFNHGEYAPKRDSEFAPEGGNPVDDIVSVLNDPNAPPILTRADLIPEKYRHPVTYFKAALGLKLLRDQILGPQRFDAAFRQYTAAWADKHPQPSDFFRAMNSAAGEDLSWFWRAWFAHNWKLDLAVTGIRRADDGSGDTLVTIANRDRLVLPATLRVSYTGGTHSDHRIPVAAWMQHRQFDIRLPAGKTVTGATIDPDHAVPDVDRANNHRVAP